MTNCVDINFPCIHIDTQYSKIYYHSARIVNKIRENDPSDWRKAAALVSQHKQAATTAETNQLNSMPLSEISIDDSGLLVVHYGSHMPVAASTPRGTAAHVQSSLQEDSYQEIIPGISQGSLYPTLSSLSSGLVAPATTEHSLHNRVTKGLDQYLQDVEQLRASEDKYFDLL